MPGYPPVRDGDWTCTETDCKASNFARRTECFKCGKERDFKAWKKQKMKEIGGSEAKKSGGLFSADDWRCNKCGNINWARRNTCNMCNAPKVEDDERTGFGGGFNDRQDVEYIDRDSSGDEIDDFGRKKKKFRSNDDKPRKEVLKPGFGEPSREAEDDDDDDEEDASKYNLDDDSDEEESSSKKETSKKNSKVSKSGKKRRSSSSSSSSSSASSKSSSSSSSNSRRRSKSGSKSRSRSRRSRSREDKKKKKNDSRKSSPPSHKKTSSSSSRRRSRSPSSSRRRSRSSSKHSHSKSRMKRSR